ncbi:hypothetical protein EIP86_000033 [Pleurotus ostreatoroseus]|nr:hypothetical protein EIP86_000033 [Pleurotus ostreatoroseus]
MANGLLVTVVAGANLIAFLVTPSALYLIFNIPLAKLYSNSLMSSLNLRPLRRTTNSVITSPHRVTSSQIKANKQNENSLPLVFGKVESHATVDTDETKKDIEWAPSHRSSRSDDAQIPTDV